MNVGSLFSGIGGMDHGLARAGFTHRFFCESDPWRRTVLEHHWPGVPIWDDVRNVASGRESGDGPLMGQRNLGSAHVDGEPVGVRTVGKPERGTVADGGGAPVDSGGWETGTGLLCGGFPCQDLSVAGRRSGLAGERSGLFFEFARIIETLRPRWVLLENVPGLLSSNDGRDFGIVLGTLADIGYGVGYRVLDSRFFGVPQRRRRVFILGVLAGTDPRGAAEGAGEVLAVGTRCPRHPPTGTQAGQDVAGTLGGGAGGRGWAQDTERMTFVPALTNGTGVRRLTPVECERLQALPDQWTAQGPDSRRYAALGDAVTSSVAEWIGRRILSATKASQCQPATTPSP